MDPRGVLSSGIERFALRVSLISIARLYAFSREATASSISMMRVSGDGGFRLKAKLPGGPRIDPYVNNACVGDEKRRETRPGLSFLLLSTKPDAVSELELEAVRH